MSSSDQAARTQYVKDVLGRFYLDDLTRPRMQRDDWRVANELYEMDVPLAAVEAAFILTKIRRDLRSPGSPTPAAIRSLAYFRPVIDEILDGPPDLSSLHTLNMRLNKVSDILFDRRLQGNDL